MRIEINAKDEAMRKAIKKIRNCRNCEGEGIMGWHTQEGCATYLGSIQKDYSVKSEVQYTFDYCPECNPYCLLITLPMLEIPLNEWEREVANA